MATAYQDQLIIWDTESRIAAFERSIEGQIAQLAFSKDVSLLAIRLVVTSNGRDMERLVVWDFENNRFTLDAEIPSIDSTYLWMAVATQEDEVAISALETVTTWNMRTGERLNHVALNERVMAIVYSRDAATIWGMGLNRMVELDPKTGQVLRDLPPHSSRGAVGSIDVDRNGQRLLLCAAGRLTLFDLTHNRLIPLADRIRDERQFFRASFSPDGTRFAASTFPRIDTNAIPALVIGDSVSGRVLEDIRLTRCALLGLGFDPAGDALWFQSFGMSGLSSARLPIHEHAGALTGRLTGAIQSMTFSPDKKTLAVAPADGEVMIIDLASGRPSSTNITGNISNLSFDRRGEYLITCDAQRQVVRWNLEKQRSEGQTELGTVLRTEAMDQLMAWVRDDDVDPPEQYRLGQFAVSLDGERLVTTMVGLKSRSRAVVWNLESRQIEQSLTFWDDWPSGERLKRFEISGDGSQLAWIRDGELGVYQIADKSWLYSIPLDSCGRETRCWFSNVANQFVCMIDGRVAVADVATRTVEWLGTIDCAPTFAFNARVSLASRGDRLAIVSNIHSRAAVTVFNVRTRKMELGRLVGLNQITALALSDDGRYMAMGLPDSRVLLWDLDALMH